MVKGLYPTKKPQDLISKSSELCLACGLCCRGMIHDHAVLAAGEGEIATRLGLDLFSKKTGSEAFALPCPCYKESKCSVYTLQRPKRCGDYQCDLITGYLQGTITFAKGLDLVKMTKGLMEAIYQHIGGADLSQRIWQQIGDFMRRQGSSLDSEDFRRTHAQFLLDVKQLSIICYRFDSRFYWGREEIKRSL